MNLKLQTHQLKFQVLYCPRFSIIVIETRGKSDKRWNAELRVRYFII